MKYLNLILLSSTWRLNHRKGLHLELNKKLSKWSEVVFIESPFSLIVHTFIKFKSRVFNKIFLIETKDKEIKKFMPVIIFHNRFWKISTLSLKIDNWLILLQLKRFIRINYTDYQLIIWADFPFNFPFTDKLKKKILIYDYYDNYSYDENGNLNPIKDELNKQMITSADLIFSTGKVMFDYAVKLNKMTFYLPNGHNMNLNLVQRETINLGLKGKVIGYIGNIRDWIDFNLLKELVNRLTENEHLVMIGPVEKNVLKNMDILKKHKQFVHLKAVEYNKIFNYIKTFDIGIIPFKINKFTEGVLPYKFFEYIASNVIIVSTLLPEVIQFKEIINVAENNQEFINLCTCDIKKLKKNEIVYTRIREESTWDKRAFFMENKLKECLNLNQET